MESEPMQPTIYSYTKKNSPNIPVMSQTLSIEVVIFFVKDFDRVALVPIMKSYKKNICNTVPCLLLFFFACAPPLAATWNMDRDITKCNSIQLRCDVYMLHYYTLQRRKQPYDKIKVFLCCPTLGKFAMHYGLYCKIFCCCFVFVMEWDKPLGSGWLGKKKSDCSLVFHALTKSVQQTICDAQLWVDLFSNRKLWIFSSRTAGLNPFKQHSRKKLVLFLCLPIWNYLWEQSSWNNWKCPC